MNQLTICFYEHPAALYDVNHWEERFKNYIEERLENNNVFFFRMKTRNEKDESVYCIPVIEGGFDLNLLLDTYNNQYDDFKSILVGSFNSATLYNIIGFVRTAEKFYLNKK